jgi:deoxycytidylate deaminase
MPRLPIESRLEQIHPPIIRRVDCPRKQGGFKSGEGLEFCVAAHAEANAIAQAARLGVRVKDASMIVSGGIPCKNCAVLMINAGIRIVYASDASVTYDGIAEEIMKEAGLNLFKLGYDKDYGLFYVPVYDHLQKNDIKLAEKLTYYVSMCELISKRSKCMSRKVGAVIVVDDCILSTGYNGPARGASHCDIRQYGTPNIKVTCSDCGEEYEEAERVKRVRKYHTIGGCGEDCSDCDCPEVIGCEGEELCQKE